MFGAQRLSVVTLVLFGSLSGFFCAFFPLFLKLSDAASLLISASRTEAYVP